MRRRVDAARQARRDGDAALREQSRQLASTSAPRVGRLARADDRDRRQLQYLNVPAHEQHRRRIGGGREPRGIAGVAAPQDDVARFESALHAAVHRGGLAAE
jgi:hypothetical protein